MVSNERLGDRRGELRFEIVGDLWATLTTAEPLPLINLGSGGLLVESADPPVVGSTHRLRLRFHQDVTEVRATVKHVRAAPDKRDRFLVGMAFLGLSGAARQAIDAVLIQHGGPGEA